jgi:hypothetical protein
VEASEVIFGLEAVSSKDRMVMRFRGGGLFAEDEEAYESRMESVKPTLPQPRSSTRMKIMLGLVGGVGDGVGFFLVSGEVGVGSP